MEEREGHPQNLCPTMRGGGEGHIPVPQEVGRRRTFWEVEETPSPVVERGDSLGGGEEGQRRRLPLLQGRREGGGP